MAFESAFDLFDNDSSGYNLKKMREELIEMKQSIKNDMDAGLSQENMAKANLALEAVDSATEVAEKAHAQMNR